MATNQPHTDPAVALPVPPRFRLEELIGRGGMGVVYRVRDRETGELLALKRLLLPPATKGPRAEKRKRFSALFEREYHTLTQLAHPRVIQVFDYGVDDHGPYYTMELLQGSDLTSISPLPWRDASRRVRDVASCLAILHSRRLLHRDVSPRNVRCTPDGRAKLIDFGAMAPMGVPEEVVGTPPCVPPEVLFEQPLDPRSDLFALGAVFYFALTRRHAYPARRLQELPRLWDQTLAAPSERIEGIPPALDRLVLALLNPDPRARPLTAAEVIDRIESIAELPPGDSVALGQAYLATPTLVAREPALATFRALLEPLQAGRGSVLFLEAEAGLGRSRLLDAFALEAKLSGATVLRAGASDAAAGPFGMARSWVDDLLRALPVPAVDAAAPYAGILGHAFPALHERSGAPELQPFANPAERTLRTQEALLAALRVVASRHRVVVLVDDLHRADPESAALLLGLAQQVGSSALLVVVTAQEGAASTVGDARRLIRETATFSTLAPLRDDETKELLRSVFGEAPRLEILADWMQRLSSGNPRLCMELAAHLLEQGHVRYQSGSWVLPTNPEALEVPRALEEVLARRLARLSADARVVAEIRALASAMAPLELEEYALLLEGENAVTRSYAALSELCAHEVLVPAGAGYVFTQPGYLQTLEAELSAPDRRARHRDLARVYAQRSTPPRLTAYHWLEAGEQARALDWLLGPSAAEPGDVVDRENALVASAYEAALAEAKRQARPPRAQIQLLGRLVDCASQVDAELTRYADELLEHLRRDTGLDLWRALDPAMDPAERTRTALAQAEARYRETPEAEQGLSPSEAVAALSGSVQMLTSAFARRREVEGQRALAALFEPLASLSPAADFTFELLNAVARRTGGQELGDRYRRLIDRAAQGVPGIDAGRLTYTRLTLAYFAAVESYQDSLSDWVLARADELERVPMFEAMAWQVRLQYHLARGHALEIAHCRKRRDLAQAQSPVTSQHASTGLQLEFNMASRYGDLLQLKGLLEPLDAEAARFPRWRPIAHQAHGEYHFACSNWDAARREFEKALGLTGPGYYTRWCDLVARCLQTMVHQGEAEAACRRGCEALRDAEDMELAWLHRVVLELAVGFAHVAADRGAEGFTRIREARGDVEVRSFLDIYAGSAETLARAALLAGEPRIFEEASARLAELYRPGRHPALLAKYEALAIEGRRRFGIGEVLDAEAREARTEARARIEGALRGATNTRERVRCALALLGEEAGGRGGFLFALRNGELACLGSHDGSTPPREMERAARSYAAEVDAAIETTMTVTRGAAVEYARWIVDGRIYHAVPLTCEWKREECFVGLVALEVEGGGGTLPSTPLLSALADSLARSGDASPVPWLDL